MENEFKIVKDLIENALKDTPYNRSGIIFEYISHDMAVIGNKKIVDHHYQKNKYWNWLSYYPRYSYYIYTDEWFTNFLNLFFHIYQNKNIKDANKNEIYLKLVLNDDYSDVGDIMEIFTHFLPNLKHKIENGSVIIYPADLCSWYEEFKP